MGYSHLHCQCGSHAFARCGFKTCPSLLLLLSLRSLHAEATVTTTTRCVKQAANLESQHGKLRSTRGPGQTNAMNEVCKSNCKSNCKHTWRCRSRMTSRDPAPGIELRCVSKTAAPRARQAGIWTLSLSLSRQCAIFRANVSPIPHSPLHPARLLRVCRQTACPPWKIYRFRAISRNNAAAWNRKCEMLQTTC